MRRVDVTVSEIHRTVNGFDEHVIVGNLPGSQTNAGHRYPVGQFEAAGNRRQSSSPDSKDYVYVNHGGLRLILAKEMSISAQMLSLGRTAQAASSAAFGPINAVLRSCFSPSA